MSGTRYLDYETVVAINAEHCGDGAGVREESGIRAALGRVDATFMGEDLYPTIASKAAVLLHGLSTTQYFHDGNKRTAWLTAKLFLSLNGLPPRTVADIEAEAFVLAVATKAFEVDEGPSRAIVKASEWFTAVRVRMSDRLDYAIIAQAASNADEDPSTFNAGAAQMGGIVASSFPSAHVLAAVVRTRWRAEDLYKEWVLRVEVDSPDNCAEIVTLSQRLADYVTTHRSLPSWIDRERDVTRYVETPALAYEDLQSRHESGVSPAISVLHMVLVLRHPGRAHLVFTMNGEVLARRLLTVGSAPELEAPDTFNEDLARLLSE